MNGALRASLQKKQAGSNEIRRQRLTTTVVLLLNLRQIAGSEEGDGDFPKEVTGLLLRGVAEMLFTLLAYEVPDRRSTGVINNCLSGIDMQVPQGGLLVLFTHNSKGPSFVGTGSFGKSDTNTTHNHKVRYENARVNYNIISPM